MAQVERGHRSLITDETWDRYHLESLLPLKETYRENAESGFLLRHYWIPATALTFRQSSRTTSPDGRVEHCDVEITRKMARCRSNECLWREKVRVITVDRIARHPLVYELLCSYNCYEQTFAFTEPTMSVPSTPDWKTESRRRALYCLPMLVPPGPVPLGFCWYAKVGDDYMNFCLDAEERVGGGTSVLVIRREGRYTTRVGDLSDARPARLGLSPSSEEDEATAIPVVVHRQGVTLFAWNRGVVLEDRFLDRIVEASGPSSSVVGTVNQGVARLIRSCPEKKEELYSGRIEGPGG
jgi:hypothetical protein